MEDRVSRRDWAHSGPLVDKDAMTQAATLHSPATLSREDVLRLGKSNRPWAFLPVAAAAMAVAPHDHGIRFLAATNLARLGLKSLAQELLDGLPHAVVDHPDIRALGAALSALPNDVLSHDHRARTTADNLETLRSRGIDLTAHLPEWEAKARSVECFRTLDGNVVRRSAAAARGDLRVLAWLRDDRRDAVEAAGAVQRPNRSFLDPVVLEGADPPWTLLEVWRRTEKDFVGYRPWMWLVQADPAELLDGLSLADLRPVLRDERVRVLAGPDATDRLEHELGARLELILPDLYLVSRSLRTPLQPAIGEALSRTLESQGAACETLRARVFGRYEARTPEYWRARFSARAQPPLRVLIPVSRFSTFVQHAAADLAGALGRAGVRAEVLHEPDEYSRLSAISYLRALDRLDPDLIVSINITRDRMREVFPAQVPFVCWLQDAMPHLFDESAGRGQTKMDFLVGHLFPELFRTFGFPRERALPSTVVADSCKFHPGPVGPSQRERFACDLAFVSHHSETPGAMHARLVAEAPEPAIRVAFERLLPDIRGAVAAAATQFASRALHEAVVNRLREALGAEPPAKATSLVLRLYAMPMADRILRHEMVGWAAEIARARGLRFHLYGNGWEKSAEFREFARGALAHADDLRAAYQAAGVSLHASIATLVHQRVLESALAGGVSIVRFHRDGLTGAHVAAQVAVMRRPPDVEEPDRIGYVTADHPEAMAYAALRSRLGLGAEPILWVSRRRAEALRVDPSNFSPDQDANWVLGDLSQFVFTSRETLERLVDQAHSNPAWRSAANTMQARRVRESLTHDALAGRMLEHVRRGLGAV